MSETPVHFRPRRLADWINPTGARKVHSLVDKVYQRKNLEMAWEKVKANRGSGGVDGQNLEAFEAQLDVGSAATGAERGADQNQRDRQEIGADNLDPGLVRIRERHTLSAPGARLGNAVVSKRCRRS